MGNKIKGIFDFKANGTTWKLQFTPNGFCELEDAAGCSTMKFLNKIGADSEAADLHIGDVRLLFWAGLKEHHPEVMLAEAGQLIHALGGVDKAMELAGEAVAAGMPQSDGSGKGAGSDGGKKTGTS